MKDIRRVVLIDIVLITGARRTAIALLTTDVTMEGRAHPMTDTPPVVILTDTKATILIPMIDIDLRVHPKNVIEVVHRMTDPSKIDTATGTEPTHKILSPNDTRGIQKTDTKGRATGCVLNIQKIRHSGVKLQNN